MTLGKKIRNLRLEHDYSQPELADLMGIEQSYLSKLENDKSLPSNDIFKKLLEAFQLSLPEFMNTAEIAEDKLRLRQIPDVDAWFRQREQAQVSHQRFYLYICSGLVAIAIALFYTGISKNLFPETRYEYESFGVVQQGEPKDIYRRWRDLVDSSDRSAYTQMKMEIEKRKDSDVQLLAEYVGPQYETKTKDGMRLYLYHDQYEVHRPINGWLEILGVLLFSLGIMGFVLEQRLLRYD